ncbi:hypothetical protein F2Q70_00016336 [Brassica cretica]|uniref:Uncharacterized protein n=1 Tax=Brassica cretica TaxID=69181 RepID=A0A8S9HTM4_BRACR|nr:hypothetical protein F2Q70_00016336 [Brassica cretica]
MYDFEIAAQNSGNLVQGSVHMSGIERPRRKSTCRRMFRFLFNHLNMFVILTARFQEDHEGTSSLAQYGAGRRTSKQSLWEAQAMSLGGRSLKHPESAWRLFKRWSEAEKLILIDTTYDIKSCRDAQEDSLDKSIGTSCLIGDEVFLPIKERSPTSVVILDSFVPHIVIKRKPLITNVGVYQPFPNPFGRVSHRRFIFRLQLVQSFCLVDVVPTLSVSNSSERDGVSKFVSSSWGLVKLGGCNRVESPQISILSSSYLVASSTGWWCSRSAPLLSARLASNVSFGYSFEQAGLEDEMPWNWSTKTSMLV